MDQKKGQFLSKDFLQLVHLIHLNTNRNDDGISEGRLFDELDNRGCSIEKKNLKSFLKNGKKLGMFEQKSNRRYVLTRLLTDVVSSTLDVSDMNRNNRNVNRRLHQITCTEYQTDKCGIRKIPRPTTKTRRRVITRNNMSDRSSSAGGSCPKKKGKICSICAKRKQCPCPSNCSLCPNRSKVKRRHSSAELVKNSKNKDLNKTVRTASSHSGSINKSNNNNNNKTNKEQPKKSSNDLVGNESVNPLTSSEENSQEKQVDIKPVLMPDGRYDFQENLQIEKDLDDFLDEDDIEIV